MLSDGNTKNEIGYFISTDRSNFEDVNALNKFTQVSTAVC